MQDAWQFVKLCLVTRIELLQAAQFGMLGVNERPSVDTQPEESEDDTLAGEIGIPEVIKDVCLREEVEIGGEKNLLHDV